MRVPVRVRPSFFFYKGWKLKKSYFVSGWLFFACRTFWLYYITQVHINQIFIFYPLINFLYTIFPRNTAEKSDYMGCNFSFINNLCEPFAVVAVMQFYPCFLLYKIVRKKQYPRCISNFSLKSAQYCTVLFPQVCR